MGERLIVEPSGERALSRCPDCENVTRQIWGFIEREDDNAAREAHAVYFARWTDGHPERGIAIAISVGGWGGNTSPRICIGLECVVGGNDPAYRFVDADSNPFAGEPTLGRHLSAQEAQSPQIVPIAMRIMNAVQACDERFAAAINARANR